MRQFKRTLYNYSNITYFCLFTMLITSPAASTAARHSRLDLAARAQQVAANSTASSSSTAALQHGLANDKAATAPNDIERTQVGAGNKPAEVITTTKRDENDQKAIETTLKAENFERLSSNDTPKKDAQLLQETKELPTDVRFFENRLKDNLGNQINNMKVCAAEFTSFEITTGYVFSAPGEMLHSLPGTLMLTDCLDACRMDAACHAVNYETGLCVLFSSHADKLPGALAKSQFPVFTLYAQKSCLRVRPCARAWSIDRVQRYTLNGYVKRSYPVVSRRDCFELCLAEAEFTCRSANYYRNTNTCELSEMDRVTLAGTGAFQPHDAVDYLENNCCDEPNKLCEFKRLPGRILKTVDSVHQDVGSIEVCRDLCLNSPYRCHSYDYGDTGDMVCRLSHHSRTTLTDVQEPYLDVPEATTYELSSCYNVTIECGAIDMVARIRTSKLFDGKVYAKGSPKSCAIDVKTALDFELRMGYQNLECNVRQSSSGRYVNDVVIQHHDTIVTSSDLGLAVACHYDLSNKSVSNDVLLDLTDDFEPALREEVIVDSPNVLMKITSRDGTDVMRTAEVGDPLALKFEILDAQSPYEIFVRELFAMDGNDNAEIMLIDAKGCPTDHFIMGPILKSSSSGKILLSHFDAFKFPTSELVHFRALVTPCMPRCEPVRCDQEDIAGELNSMISYGRRRRSLNLTGTVSSSREHQQLIPVQDQQSSNREPHLRLRSRRATTASGQNSKTSQEDMLLVQSIQITDKFGFEKQQQQKQLKAAVNTDSDDKLTSIGGEAKQEFCLNFAGLTLAVAVFLLAQLAMITVWSYLRQRHRKVYSSEALTNGSIYSSYHNASSTNNSSLMSKSCASRARTESLNKIYDQTFYGQNGRKF